MQIQERILDYVIYFLVIVMYSCIFIWLNFYSQPNLHPKKNNKRRTHCVWICFLRTVNYPSNFLPLKHKVTKSHESFSGILSFRAFVAKLRIAFRLRDPEYRL